MKNTFLERLLHIFLPPLFRLLYGIRFYGKSRNYPHAALLIPNHISFLDPIVVTMGWKQLNVHYLADRALFKIPIFGSMIAHLRAHPISGSLEDVRTVKVIYKALLDKDKIMIFPEGGISVTGQLKPFRSGFAKIAIRNQCAIIPVYIYGTNHVWPRNKFFPKLWGKLACVYGTPILPEEFSSLSKDEVQDYLKKRVKQAIQDLEDWYLKGAAGHPP